jgi:hypothetical protein
LKDTGKKLIFRLSKCFESFVFYADVRFVKVDVRFVKVVVTNFPEN